MDPRDPRWKTAEARQAVKTSPNKELLTKYMDLARAPEADLILLCDDLEKTNPEAAKFVDEAIDLFARARSRLDHARSRLKDW